ncbi:amino acid adenylation domain-containing protein [Saccharopolyspora taberi]|uniref:Carrier domain-containing protein n=1 Tax=Saccharopolyspora taberi TaxID=60895 RepID=A0ABN3VEV9_9PSEU
MIPESAENLTDLLRLRADEHPDRVGLRFLTSGEVDGESEEWSFGELDLRARTIAAQLQEIGVRGERVILLYPPTADFVAAFFGCLYAGAVAVPAYPHPTSTRLHGIARDAGARAVLAPNKVVAENERFTRAVPELAAARWTGTGESDVDIAARWQRPAITGESLAFLQYTSGSTATPKGVMVSHGNLLHNERLIKETFGNDQETSSVGWLPLFHDMGLIGNLLHPLYLGNSCTLMSPQAFLQQPARWLRAISEYGGVLCGGPNFGYELCVRKVRPEQCEGLDLSGWAVAFNGAEPVRQDTIDRFTAKFADFGFRPEAMCPCYGLAEATLLVSGVGRHTTATQRRVDADALARNRVADATDPGQQPMVSVGTTGAEHEVAIADPETHQRCEPDAVGEIWVSGPSVAHGYWNQPEESERTFRAHLVGDDRRTYLRTGDLGFVADGELYVTGRIKDVIILRGRNIYPQDVELAVERSHPAVRPGESGAFAVEVDGEERLAVVTEVDLGDDTAPEPVIDAIRAAVLREFDLPAHTVALLSPRSIPKTSSGKIRRGACREGLRSGGLKILAHSVLDERPPPPPRATGAQFGLLDALEVVGEEGRASLVERFVQRECARVLGCGPEQVDLDSPPAALGLDSLTGAEIQGAVQDALRVSLDMGFLWQQPSLRDAARQVVAAWEGADDAGSGLPELVHVPGESQPVASSGQQRLWVLSQLASDTPVYNIHFGLRIEGPVDQDALRSGVTELVRRHTALRTVLREVGRQVRQVVVDPAPVDLPKTDLTTAAEPEAELERVATALAAEPFDLAAGPLVRFHLVAVAAEDHVLLVTQHHTITDGWSTNVLARELAEIYEALVQDTLLPADPRFQYADYARWEQSAVELLSEDEEFWSRQLAGLPRLELPGDRPRPPMRTYRGGRVRLELSRRTSARLLAIGREEGCTPFVTLLAGYAAFLHRYTGKEDFAIGSIIANRGTAETQELVGFLANTVVLRCDLSGKPTFRELLRRLRSVAADGFKHGRLPFAETVRAVGGAGDDVALFETCFVLENNPTRRVDTGGTTWRPFVLAPDGAVEGTAKFDLSLALEDNDGVVSGTLEYSADRFDGATAQRMAGNLQMLFAGATATPDAAIRELPVMTPDQRQAVLQGWNDTDLDVPHETAFPELFEAQVRRTPDRIAVVCEDQRLSYRELNARANRLAHHLRRSGLRSGEVVALLMDRGPDLLTAILAVFKAGAAYLPLDPDHPANRHVQVLEQAGAGLVISTAEFASTLVAERESLPVLDIATLGARPESEEDLGLTITPGHLAYVFFTSGSTGVPKGAMVEHRGMVNHLYAKIHDLGLGQDDVVAQTASQCFDISVWQFLSALLVGGQVRVYPREVALDATGLLERADQDRITILEMVPSLLATSLDALHRGGSTPRLAALRWLLMTGEALPPGLVRRWLGYWPEVPMLNAYGPTECSDDVTHCSIPDVEAITESNTPIGVPIANTRLYVLDGAFEPVPVGVFGELFVGGVGVGRGYVGDGPLTAERFVPDPFGDGGRLYRTGDVVRWLPDGRLEFAGRVDHQVKIRGHRVELGEIESVLQRCPGVGQAVVVLREDIGGGPRLVGYVTGEGLSSAELCDWVGQWLPGYMVPSAVVVLKEFPVTPNGKVDRASLPVPDRSDVVGAGFVAPRGPVEQAVAEVWAQVLGLDQVGVYDDFFALGGHSLLATQIMTRLRETFGVAVSLRELFESPTVAALAGVVTSASGREQAPPIPVVDRDGDLPLSFAQQRLWFLDQLSPGEATYNVPGMVRLSGAVDIDGLRWALDQIVTRHESLRTRFAVKDDVPVQVVEPAGGVDIEVAEALGASDEHVREWARERARWSFDLRRGPLFRVSMLRVAPDEWVLVVALHHSVSDGWSLGVLLRELSVLYGDYVAGRQSSLPELPVQYADFAVWQREWLDGGVLEPQLDYWRSQLAGAPAGLPLPTDRPRTGKESREGAHLPVSWDAELIERLREVAREAGATLYMTVLAAFQVVLGRFAGTEDVVVGSPVAGRTRPELEGLIGFFVNTLVMRTDLSGSPSFDEVLRRVRENALEAYAHQDVPFERLVEELAPPRDAGRTPLFQVMFVLQNAPVGELELNGVEVNTSQVSTETAKFELTLSLEEVAGGVEGYLEYDTSLFDADTAQRVITAVECVLAAVAADPSRPVRSLPLMPEPEYRRVIEEWNNTSGPIPHNTVHELFEQHAHAHPHAIALIQGTDRLSYDELNRKANRLAHHLLAGTAPETPVGVHLQRSTDFVTSILGILKAGCAYVPLDPGYPADRLALMVSTAGISTVLTDAEDDRVRDVLGGDVELVNVHRDEIQARPDHDPRQPVSPDGAAYVIFTSGSTGTPNGVVGLHRGAVNRIAWMRERYAFEPHEVGVVKTSVNFVDSVWEIFGPLVSGVPSVILPDDVVKSPPELVRALRECGATRIVLVPSLLRALLDDEPKLGELLPELWQWTSSGESLPLDVARRFEQSLPGRTLLNLYGSSEVSADSVALEVESDTCVTSVPIGGPIANTRVYVLDGSLEPVPVGVHGELFVGGEGLARGYVGDGALTAERFVPDPFGDGERLYRTGDLGRWLPDGRLEFVGRVDHQVKVRGHRVELGEIESVLLRHPDVGQAVVVLREDIGDDARLIGYVTGEGLNSAELSAWVGQWLPGYMAPSAVVVLERFPVTPNGKIDRAALPVPDRSDVVGAGFVAPRGPVEQAVAEVWAQVLGLDQVGIYDDFFALGGHSLMATQIVTRLRDKVKVELELRRLFENPTVAGVAELVEQLTAGETAPAPSAIPRQPRKRVSLPADTPGE